MPTNTEAMMAATMAPMTMVMLGTKTLKSLSIVPCDSRSSVSAASMSKSSNRPVSSPTRAKLHRRFGEYLAAIQQKGQIQTLLQARMNVAGGGQQRAILQHS